MADSNDLETLETLVTCQICNDILTEPKALPCQHCFCFGCIQAWFQSCRRERRQFDCPSCRALITVPGEDVANLTTSFQSNSLIQLYHSSLSRKKQQDYKDAQIQITKENDDLKRMLQMCMTAQAHSDDNLLKIDIEIDSAKNEVRNDVAHKIQLIKDGETAKLGQLEAIRTGCKTKYETVNVQIGEHIQKILDLSNRCEQIAKFDLEQFHSRDFQQLCNECKTTIERATSSLSANKAIQTGNALQHTGQNQEVTEILNSLHLREIDVNITERKEQSDERAAGSSQSSVKSYARRLKPVRLFDIKAATFPCISLALNGEGELAVICVNKRNKYCILLHSANGKYLRKIGDKGSGDARLRNPGGIAFAHDNRILVSDNADDYTCLKEYDIDGRFLRTVHEQKRMSFRGMTTSEQSISCLSYNTKSEETSIVLFSKETASHLKDIKLHAPDIKRVPLYLAYGGHKYFVSFYMIHSIYVFGENGDVLYTIGEKGTQPGQFKSPRGLAVFVTDMLLVCDSENHRVQLFNQNGHYVRSIGNRGSGLGQMNFPKDVFVTPDGQFFVLQYYGKRIQVFK